MRRLSFFCYFLLACTQSSLPGDAGTSDVPDVPSFDVPTFDVPVRDVQPPDVPTPLPDVPPPPPDVPAPLEPVERFRQEFFRLCELNAACGNAPGDTCEDPEAFFEFILSDLSGESQACIDANANLTADILECVSDLPCPELEGLAVRGELSESCAPTRVRLDEVGAVCSER